MPLTRRLRSAYWTKSALTVGLIAAADVLFYQAESASFGFYGLALCLAVLLAVPAVRHDRRALLALAFAGALALLSFERPSLMMAWLCLLALGVGVLSPRARASDDVWPWAQRLLMAGVRGLGGPVIDSIRLRARRLRRRRSTPEKAYVSALLLPVVGGLVFIALFSAANPLIGTLLAKIRVPHVEILRSIFWGGAGVLVWGLLRPRGLRRTIAPPDVQGDLKMFGVTTTSLTLSLIVFNALFALQNGLDLAFLWSHAPLPEGVTLAEYAHRGAYLLIVTAILAGGFVLFALRPGSTTAASPAVRWMVVLFVAQNLLLVASSALRTWDYVEAYGLTRLRIAALFWMALVAIGLVLICVRLLKAKSSSWLINANTLTAAVAILIASLIDLGAVAATWNAHNAREVNGHGPRLDLCYLENLGPSALVPLTELEGRPLPRVQAEATTSVRSQVMAETQYRQAHWRTWSWRNARRVHLAETLVKARPPVPPTPERRCDGQLIGPPAEADQPATLLTVPPQP